MRCLHVSSGEKMWLGCAVRALPGGGSQRVILGSEGDVGVQRGRRTEAGVWAQRYPSAPRVPGTYVYTITQNLSASLWTKTLTSPLQMRRLRLRARGLDTQHRCLDFHLGLCDSDHLPGSLFKISFFLSLFFLITQMLFVLYKKI